jgi:hypothetical protein
VTITTAVGFIVAKTPSAFFGGSQPGTRPIHGHHGNRLAVRHHIVGIERPVAVGAPQNSADVRDHHGAVGKRYCLAGDDLAVTATGDRSEGVARSDLPS